MRRSHRDSPNKLLALVPVIAVAVSLGPGTTSAARAFWRLATTNDSVSRVSSPKGSSAGGLGLPAAPGGLLRVDRYPHTDTPVPVTVSPSLRDAGLGPPRSLSYRRYILEAPPPADGSSPSQARLVYDQPWPDLTGDGLDDVVGLDTLLTRLESEPGGPPAGTRSRVKLTAYDGLTGRKLWRISESVANTLTAEGDVAFLPAKVGPGGRNGVIVKLYKSPGPGHVFKGITHRGKKAWTYRFGSGARLASVGLFDSLPGAATDVLIGIQEGPDVGIREPVNRTSPAILSAAIINGKNGKVRTHDAVDLGWRWLSYPQVGPDLDGDKLEDYIVVNVLPGGLPAVTDSTSYYFRGRKGSNGDELWTSDPLQVKIDLPQFFFDARLGDVTGDRLNDLLVYPWRHDLDEGEQTVDDHQIFAVDGARGSLLWSAHGQLFDIDFKGTSNPGDLNSDGRSDVFTMSPTNTGKRPAATVLAYSGADGKRLYRRTFRLRRARRGGQTVVAQVQGADIDGDGSPEVKAWLGWWRPDRPTGGGGRWFFLSARTGKMLRPSLRPQTGFLSRSLDGRGDDLFIMRRGRSVDFFDGDTRRRLLSLTFDAPASGRKYHLSLEPARLNRDRCTDLLATLTDFGDNSFVMAIDGGSGKIMWARTQKSSVKGSARLTRRVDRNRSC